MSAIPFARSKIHDAALRLFAERGTSELAVSELADAAGVARGTIYNNIERPEDLFGEVASDLAREMVARVEASMAAIDDPAARLATGLRLFLRRAHEEPHWGRFIIRFAATSDILRAMMDEPPARDVARAIKTGRFKVEESKLNSVVSLLGGAVLSGMQVVLSGHQTWREASSNTAELFLRATGVAPAEARRIAQSNLPPLAEAPDAPNKSRAKRKPS